MLSITERLPVLKSKELRKIIENFGFLSFLKLLSVLLPLISYPYIMKVIGNEKFGLVLIFQGIMNFLILIIGYGFNLTATKELAENVEDYNYKNKIFTEVFVTKLLIASLIFIPYMIYTYFYIDSELRSIYFLGGLYILGEISYVQWFFHGIQKVKYLTYITVSIKCFSLLLIYMFVNNDEHMFRVALIFSFEYFLIGLFTFITAVLIAKIKPYKFKLSSIVEQLKKGSSIFSVVVVTSLKDRFNLIYIGAVFGSGYVVIFDLGIKIMTALSLPSTMLALAAYPLNARTKSAKDLKKVIFACLSLTSIAFVTFLWLFSYIDTYFLNLKAEEITFIKIIVSSSLFLCISSTIATNGLAAFGFNKVLLKNVASVLVVYLIMIAAIYVYPDEFGYQGFIIGVVVVYFYEMLSRVLTSKKLRIL